MGSERSIQDFGESDGMFVPNRLVIDRFVDVIRSDYQQAFGVLEPHFPGILAWSGRMALETIELRRSHADQAGCTQLCCRYCMRAVQTNTSKLAMQIVAYGQPALRDACQVRHVESADSQHSTTSDGALPRLEGGKARVVEAEGLPI